MDPPVLLWGLSDRNFEAFIVPAGHRLNGGGAIWGLRVRDTEDTHVELQRGFLSDVGANQHGSTARQGEQGKGFVAGCWMSEELGPTTFGTTVLVR